jgi:hypothetical protein
MPEPIRVRDNVTGHEYSTYGTAIEGLTQLDEDALDVHGDILPPKYPTAPPIAKPAAATPTGPKATPKES